MWLRSVWDMSHREVLMNLFMNPLMNPLALCLWCIVILHESVDLSAADEVKRLRLTSRSWWYSCTLEITNWITNWKQFCHDIEDTIIPVLQDWSPCVSSLCLSRQEVHLKCIAVSLDWLSLPQVMSCSGYSGKSGIKGVYSSSKERDPSLNL